MTIYEKVLLAVLIIQVVLIIATPTCLCLYDILECIPKFKDRIKDKKETFNNVAAYLYSYFCLLCFVVLGILLAMVAATK